MRRPSGSLYTGIMTDTVGFIFDRSDKLIMMR